MYAFELELATKWHAKLTLIVITDLWGVISLAWGAVIAIAKWMISKLEQTIDCENRVFFSYVMFLVADECYIKLIIENILINNIYKLELKLFFNGLPIRQMKILHYYISNIVIILSIICAFHYN